MLLCLIACAAENFPEGATYPQRFNFGPVEPRGFSAASEVSPGCSEIPRNQKQS